MTFEVIDKTTGEVADADELGASIALDEENCVSWFAVENSDDGGMVYIVNSEGHCKRLPPDRFEVRFPEVEALQSGAAGIACIWILFLKLLVSVNVK